MMLHCGASCQTMRLVLPVQYKSAEQDILAAQAVKQALAKLEQGEEEDAEQERQAKEEPDQEQAGQGTLQKLLADILRFKRQLHTSRLRKRALQTELAAWRRQNKELREDVDMHKVRVLPMLIVDYFGAEVITRTHTHPWPKMTSVLCPQAKITKLEDMDTVKATMDLMRQAKEVHEGFGTLLKKQKLLTVEREEHYNVVQARLGFRVYLGFRV